MHSILSLVLGFAAYQLASCVPNDSRLGPRQSKPDYSYTGVTGPTYWGKLSPDYALCSTGNNQSPINIDGSIGTDRVSSAAYPEVPSATATNNGKTIQIDTSGFNPRGNLTIGNKLYLLENIHVHTPSEHHIFNEHYPLEVHFVHKSITDANDLAVAGFVFEIGSQGSQALDDVVAAIAQTGTAPLDLRAASTLLRDTTFYRYPGSLTTPPCSQGVTWMVANQAARLDERDYNAIKDKIKFNARFIQNRPGQDNVVEDTCR